MRVEGEGLRVQGSGFRAQGSGIGVQGLAFSVQGSGLWVLGVQSSCVWVQGLGFLSGFATNYTTVGCTGIRKSLDSDEASLRSKIFNGALKP